MDWKEHLSPQVKSYLEHVLLEVQDEREAYTQAPNISKAQLWTAVAYLARKLATLEYQLKEQGSKKTSVSSLKKF